MKSLIAFCITILFCVTSFANWFPVGKENARTIWTDKSKCEKAEGQECFDITDINLAYYDLVTEKVDDKSQPIFKSRYNVTACKTVEDCQKKMRETGGNFCKQGDSLTYKENAVMPGFSYFCHGIEGYKQITMTFLKLNEEKKAAYEVEQKKIAREEQALQQIQKDVLFGEKIIKIMGLRVRAKSLNRGQTKQVITTYKDAIELLRVGSIKFAQEEITGIEPDGSIVTAQDKATLLKAISDYLGE